MNPQTLSVIEHYEKLSPVVATLYAHMDKIAQVALMPLFLLSIFLAYTQDLGLTGTVLKRLKNLVLTALLLAAFPDVSELIRTLGQELAISIDGLQGLDKVLAQAASKAGAQSGDPLYLLTLSNDLLLRFFVNASFTILFFARLGLVAFYHFYWMFLVVTAPLLILGQLFDSTNALPKNLFKNLILVAMWPVAWSLLSVFLEAVPFTNAYNTEGGYTALIVLNLIIAVSMFLSPFLLSSFCDGLLVNTGSALYSAAKSVTYIAAPKLAAASQLVGKHGVAPAMKRVMPNSAKRFAERSKAKVQSYMRNRKRPKEFYALALILLGSGFVQSTKAEELVIKPKGLLVLCLKETPQSAFLSESKYFGARIIGPKKVLLRAQKEGAKSELLVLYKSGTLSSFEIVTSSILPSKGEYGCDPVIVTPKVNSKATRVRKSAFKTRDSSISVSLNRIFWTNSKRDYLNVEISVQNISKQSITPKWGEVVLKNGSRNIKLSKLWSERSAILPTSSIKARLEFKKPELSSKESISIVFPYGSKTLSIPLSKEVLK